MSSLTDFQFARMSFVVRHDSAMSAAHVPGNAQRQMLSRTSVRPVALIALAISV